MKSKWDGVKLGDYCSKIGSGSTPRGGSSVYLETGEYALFRSQNILNNTFSSNGLVYIDSEAAKKLKNVSIEEDDVLLNITGDSVARVCKVPSQYLPARVNQHVAIIRTKQNELNSSYVNYYLNSQSMQNYMLSISSAGATRNALTKVMIENFEIPKPPIEIQKKIAHILSTLDDKIELNRKMNETLEAMAQALFKSWFVDFDPVHARAKADSDAELELAAKELGISKEILELFPSEFVESEMGMIPSGWEVSTIEDEFNVTMGQSPSGKSYNETQNGMIFFQGRRDFGTYFPSERVYTTEPKRLAKEDDILLSVRAPVGDINIAMKECCIGRGLSALKHKSDSLGYSYLVLKNLRVYFDGYNTEGTVFGSVNQNTLKSLKILKDEQIIQKFNKIVDPMFKQIKNNSVEILSLQKTRDTLLPKLLSGELDVSEVEL